MRKMKQFKWVIPVLAFLFSISTSFAQKSITGIVTDQDGRGVPSVNITVKNSKTGTQSDANGAYQITVPDGATLIFTSVGFGTKEISVGNRSSINATLASVNTNLAEVVVIGYGTARRRDLTGAVTSINEKNFNKGTFNAPDQLIQGKVAGVQVIQNSGAPGGASTVKIRGNSALTGSGQPLYVVDGVILDGRSARPGIGDVGFGGGNPGSNPLNFINPNDIASMEVLKDASASAIYGSRAAYGVVLITTKKGSTGAPKIDFSTSVGFSNVMRKIRVLDAGEFRQALTYYGLNANNDKKSSTNAFDAITRQGIVQNYSIGISGGTDGARYRFSVGALNQDGIVRKTGFKKYSANLSGQFKFLNSKRVGLDVNVIPSQFIEDIAPISNDAGSRGSLIGNALQWNPTEPLTFKRANGTDSLNIVRGGDLVNPLALQQAIDDRSKVTTVLASISPYFKISDGLEFRFLYSLNYSTGIRRSSVQPFINFNDVLDKGRARIASNELTTQQFTNTLSYNRQLTSKLYMNAVAGFEFLKSGNKGFDFGGFGLSGNPNGFGFYGLDFTNYIQFTDPTTRSIGSFVDPSVEIQSYFARTMFNYQDRYLLTATFRADGSSKFGANTKYGYFPSFSAAWVVSKESFFHVDQINALKLRGGWGKTGNQEFPAGSATARYRLRADGTNADIRGVNSFNGNLSWQEDRQYNFGMDMSLLKSRITITLDYFNKQTKKLLYPSEPAQPVAPGAAIRWVNLPGTIENKGFEVSVNSVILNKKDFGIDFNVNASFIKNSVSGLPSVILTGALHGQGLSGASVETIRNGLPINAFYTKRFAGFDKTSGIAIFPDGDALSYQGDPNPHTLLGISTSVRYKELSLSVNMNGAFGYKIYNNTLNSVINVGSINNGKNIAYSVFKDPTKESFANPLTASSRFLESGNYLKMANATLSYNIGNLGNNAIRGVNLFVTGQNLFVITKFGGFDPEVNTDKNINGVPSASIEYIPYPTARTITFGLNFSL